MSFFSPAFSVNIWSIWPNTRTIYRWNGRRGGSEAIYATIGDRNFFQYVQWEIDQPNLLSTLCIRHCTTRCQPVARARDCSV